MSEDPNTEEVMSSVGLRRKLRAESESTPSAAEKPPLIERLHDEAILEAASRHSGQAVDAYSACSCGHAVIDHQRFSDHDECTISECECDRLQPIYDSKGNFRYGTKINTDLSLLDQHDAEPTEKVRKPLVDLLQQARDYFRAKLTAAMVEELITKIDAALAKVKVKEKP